MAAKAPEQWHHSTHLLHPRCCCGKWCWQKRGEGASVWKKSGGLEPLFSAGLEQNTFGFCQQNRGSPPVTQIRFAFAEAVGSDSAEEQQLRA